MSLDPHEWRNRPAPLSAWVSAVSSFFAVCLGVLVIFVGGVMVAGAWVDRLPSGVRGLIGPALPLTAIVLGLLSAYSAFQQARIRAAKKAAARGRRQMPRPLWRRPGFVQPLATLVCGLLGAAIGFAMERWPADRGFFTVAFGLLGLLVGLFGSAFYLVAVGGYGPADIAGEVPETTCPGCGELLAGRLENCPLCGAKVGRQ